jgi:hypothetical protein
VRQSRLQVASESNADGKRSSLAFELVFNGSLNLFRTEAVSAADLPLPAGHRGVWNNSLSALVDE